MNFSPKILFLYSELAGYTVNCFNNYVTTNPNAEIHIIRWPLNKEAPFNFNFNKNIFIKEKQEVEINKDISEINPDIVICSGWFDKEYLKSIKQIHKKIPTVLMFDNYWEGNIKQKIGRLLLPSVVTKYFDFCWVPGEIQKKYALKIGFKNSQIFLGFYANDLTNFNKEFTQNIKEKERNFPKTFLYVGRYLKLKGIEDLWNAFAQFSEKNKEWKLHCVGTGKLFEKRFKHPNIIHHGFVQPSEFDDIIKNSGVFIMPSHYDHWGMAVQEFAAAGLPLICSNTVGAASVFLKPGKNGFIFKAKNVKDLVKQMHKTADLSNKELLQFSMFSHKLSDLYTPESWANTLNKIILLSKK